MSTRFYMRRAKADRASQWIAMVIALVGLVLMIPMLARCL